MAKWSDGASKHILIQQDNARPYIADKDEDFRAAASRDGFQMTLVEQPPNSPDCNVNDVGWFMSIQSLQVDNACKNIEELLEAVTKSFNELSATTLNDVFLSLQGCMIEIMKGRGQNRYKVPHWEKDALRRIGQLPLNLEVSKDLVTDCINYLKEMGENEGIDAVTEALQIQDV